MGFSRLSRTLKEQRKITLDTAFISEYMPLAPEHYTKVYLTGLAFSTSDDNELDEIALSLDMERQAVMEAFFYWQQQELVNVSIEPPSVEYLPVISIAKRVPKFEKEKYKTFNDQLHVLIKDRPISPNEYNEYYTVMELKGIEIEAMLTIIGHCIRLKGTEVGHRYITTVARNLADQGYRTYDRVQERLSEFDLYDADLKATLKALKLKRNPDHADRILLLKWKKELGFMQETIIGVAKNISKGGVQMLDTLLNRYYENRRFSMKEINEFNKNREEKRDLAKSIIKTLGLWYDTYDQVVETYVSPWLGMGFSEDALKMIADYCFRLPNRSLENMNHFVKGFYKQGRVSKESIHGFLHESLLEDEQIKELLVKLGLFRLVTSHDRDYYKTWTHTWKISEDLVNYACELSKDKSNPFGYMNGILANWFEKKIITVKEAKALNPKNGVAAASNTVVAREGNKNFVSRALTAEELNAMFDRLSDDEL